MQTKISFRYALVGMLATFAALQGCSDDDNGNDKPPTVVKPTGGSTGQGGDDTNGGGTGNTGNTAGKSSKGGNTSNGGTGAEGGVATTPNGGAGGEGGAPEPTCLLPERGENDCYNCPVKGELVQWLNRCVNSECAPFDNSRVKLIKQDGSLPALP